jgi:3-hydroxybutyrate dehydrogenase
MITQFMNGKCALVTGSVDGLGFAIATALAKAGANVVLNGLCEVHQGETAARELARKHDVEAAFDPADLRDRTEIQRMVTDAEKRFGSIDVVVNNAVVRHFSPIEAFDPEHWEESLQVNVTAAFHLTRLTLAGMKRRGWGRIINQASYYAWRGAENRIDYVTTKSALIGMSRAIAIEAAGTGVTSNAVCPGSVGTPAILERIAGMARQQARPFDEVAREYAAARNPMGRFVAMESIGALVVFLCSSAGDDVNGAVLPVDGGWLAA